MNRPLVGWDYATWRVSQMGVGLNPNIVCIAKISGIVDFAEITSRMARLVTENEIFSLAIVDNSLVKLENFDFAQQISINNSSVRHLARDFLERNFDEGKPLWNFAIVYQGSETLLVSLIHHAIADGNTAQNLLRKLLDNVADVEPNGISERGKASNRSESGLTGVISRLVSDPKGLISDINALLSSVNNLISDSQAPVRKSSIQSIDLELLGLKFATKELNEIARINNVGIHDVMTGIAFDLGKQLNIFNKQGSKSLIVNVPVALNAGPNVFNQIMVARLQLPAATNSFVEFIKASRQKLQSWRREPALKLAPKVLELASQVADEKLLKFLEGADLTVSTLKTTSPQGHFAGKRVVGLWPMVNPLGAHINFTSLVSSEEVFVGVCFYKSKAQYLDSSLIDFRHLGLNNWQIDFFEQNFE